MTGLLSDRMRELALEGHPRGDELIQMAEELDAALEQPTGDSRSATQRLVHRWMAARTLMRDCTGEPIIDVSAIQRGVDSILGLRRG